MASSYLSSRLKPDCNPSHSQPDFSPFPITTEEEVGKWLQFFEMSTPLVCCSTFISHDPVRAGWGRWVGPMGGADGWGCTGHAPQHCRAWTCELSTPTASVTMVMVGTTTTTPPPKKRTTWGTLWRQRACTALTDPQRPTPLGGTEAEQIIWCAGK